LASSKLNSNEGIVIIDMTRLKFTRNFALAIVLCALIIIVAVVVINSNLNSGRGSSLDDIIAGGESTFTAIGRNHESLTRFMKNEEELARDVLKTAVASRDHARVKFTSARNTDDDFVLNMAENYEFLLQGSDVMTEGVDNLLYVSEDLEEALGFFRKGAYAEAAEKALVCWQTLSPLVGQFDLTNQSLDGVNYHYIASGHRDRARFATVQYRDEMRVYFEYVSLLESIMEGVDYLNAMDMMNDLFDQLQHALATGNYENAQSLLQEISNQLQLLKDPQYQGAAATASGLDPSLFDGAAFNIAQDLQNQLKDLEGIEEFENYLESLMKYMEALNYYEQGDIEAAEEAIDEGLFLSGQGEDSANTEVQRYFNALQSAFNSLRMQIRGQPLPG
jgi:tetratricopeptide (TPR) repeat protein